MQSGEGFVSACLRGRVALGDWGLTWLAVSRAGTGQALSLQ